MNRNLILCTDSYKTSHYLQYPPGTDALFSYVEARSKGLGKDLTVFFGLQAILKEYLAWPITFHDIEQAEIVCKLHGVPFNTMGWLRILKEHNGYMPVRIRAVPEGTVVPTGNVLMTVESTDPELPWVGSFLETLLLRVWYPTTVATRSYLAKQVIKAALEKSADNLDGLPFKLHDFGARGVSSGESAALGGMGHLVNFMGTDTMEALLAAQEFYDCDMAGFSIPAAEHSTITSWGRGPGNEVDAYRNMIKQYGKPGAIYAVVSDSYNIYNAVDLQWGVALHDEVVASGATLVIRPDSGDPVTLLPELARIIEKRFGCTTNSKGYKVFNHVRMIQGDGIDSPERINAILNFFMAAGYSADNLAFGMGGGLLQKCDRDTFSFAMKCSAARVNGEWRDVYKDPVGDSGKKSKKGMLDLIQYEDGTFKTVRENEIDIECGPDSALHVVYENGQFFNETTLDEIRKRTA
jgi:nicotinamide phosphoribosyltransferase